VVDKAALGRFTPSTSVPPAKHSTDFSTHTSSSSLRADNIGNLVVLVIVDSVQPHPMKQKYPADAKEQNHVIRKRKHDNNCPFKCGRRNSVSLEREHCLRHFESLSSDMRYEEITRSLVSSVVKAQCLRRLNCDVSHVNWTISK
jgi:hypothetical protein